MPRVSPDPLTRLYCWRVDRRPGSRAWGRNSRVIRLALTCLACCCLWASSGCAPLELPARLPSQTVFSQSNLLIHSDFALLPGHRLLDQLPARKSELATALGLELAAEPIAVYLFADEATFARYARQNLPGFAGRRALFVKTDTRLMVLAHWQDQLGEDLRHELTHAYLHATLPWLPLWLDEGLAEYFELAPQAKSLHARHVYHLAQEFKAGRWQPGIERLENFQDPSQFQETQYAESWLWVDFLLSTTPERLQLFQNYAAELRNSSSPQPELSTRMGSSRAAWELAILDHLKELATELQGSREEPASADRLGLPAGHSAAEPSNVAGR